VKRLVGGTLSTLMLASCLWLPGCATEPGEAPVEAEQESASVSQVVTVAETTQAPLPYREFVLPPGGTVGGYAERTACLLEPVSEDSGSKGIRLLDLETGANERVVSAPVNEGEGSNILSARCSDAWLLWEETVGDSLESPLDVQWALYAIPFDGIAASGDPVEVTASVGSAQSRPLFSVVGDTAYWMTNSAANARQEGVIDQARVWACDLPDGEPRVLYSTPSDAFTFSAQPGELLLTEAIDRNEDPGKLVVLDPENGSVLREIPLDNDGWLSHYTSYSDEMCAWSVGSDDGVNAGDFFFRDAGGEVTLVSKSANDSVFVGDYLFYEHKPYEAKGTSNRVQHWKVCALDTNTLEYFVVFDEEARVFGWVAPIGVAPRTDGYLMYRSVPSWITEEEPGTWVRVYSIE